MPANISCVECGGEYAETDEAGVFECDGCGHRLETADEDDPVDPDEVRDMAETVRELGLGVLAHELEEGARRVEEGDA